MKSVHGVLSVASKVAAIPGLSAFSRPANRVATESTLASYLAAQSLARQAVKEIGGLVREGWTERQAADLLDTYLADHGVRSFFHRSFVWFGDRTRFRGVKHYFDYLPGKRVVRPGEIFILDVAPIVDGYVCDIGYTLSLGENAQLAKAKAHLADLRRDLPAMFSGAMTGGEVWREIDQRIRDAGYDDIHALYPFSVLGHRVHKVKAQFPGIGLINFGWQSYWEFLSRGLFGQLLNGDFAGDLTGLWAIEPHVGGEDFGAKFEEILVVEQGTARWLDAEPFI